MPVHPHEHIAADGVLPQLSDDCAVQIHDFIYHVLDLFEVRYGDQVRRYYDERSQHNIMRRPDRPQTTDDPPF